MENNYKRFLGLLVGFSFMLSGCNISEPEDPFEKLPEEVVDTIEGKIFPFSVSVATRATHRLERDGKLVAYIASNIVRLEDFEGREVSLDGVMRNEKMKPIFWVEGIRLLDTDKVAEEETEKYFETKDFFFVYPSHWDFSTAPNGTAYFLDATDESRKVFLTFSVEELDEKDKVLDPNLLIANMAGLKEVEEDEKTGKHRETITLLSNIESKKYVFVFNSTVKDFERKKAFTSLLNSFVEGEQKVRAKKEAILKAKAALEAKKIAADKEKERLEAAIAEAEAKKAELESEADTDSFLAGIFDKKNDESRQPAEEERDEGEALEEAPQPSEGEEATGDSDVLKTDFVNLVDARAFDYRSSHYGFALKSPYGYWFQNFGASEAALAEIGFSNEEMNGRASAKFWLRVVSDDTPVTEKGESLEGNTLTVVLPRSASTYFKLSGPTEFRDAMWSIVESIEIF